MDIKRILLPLPGSTAHKGEADVGLVVAKTFGAELEALFITERPPLIRWATDEEEERARLAREWFAQAQENVVRSARELFARACSVRGVPLIAESEEPPSLPTACWRWVQTEGFFENVVGHRAAAFDLVVAANPLVLQWLRGTWPYLLATHRLVLLAPMSSGDDLKLTAPAMVAWDESIECWHALSAALPFLKLARSVELIRVDENGHTDRATQEEALKYLQRHGITATARIVTSHFTVGRTLLSESAKRDPGLLVMGAYSHSPVRELFLGGTTHHVVEHAATRPVLMAH